MTRFHRVGEAGGLRRRRVLGVLTVLAAPPLLGLSACGTPRVSAQPAWSGRLAWVLTPALSTGGTPPRSAQFQFELWGDALAGQLDVLSPLGQVLARVVWKPGEAVMTSPGRDPLTVTRLDDLSEAALGEAMPLQALIDWLQGQAWPLAPMSREEQGFSQLGWHIDTRKVDQGRVLAQRPVTATQAGLRVSVVLDTPPRPLPRP